MLKQAGDLGRLVWKESSSSQIGRLPEPRLEAREVTEKHLLDWLAGHSQKSDGVCSKSCHVAKKALDSPSSAV